MIEVNKRECGHNVSKGDWESGQHFRSCNNPPKWAKHLLYDDNGKLLPCPINDFNSGKTLLYIIAFGFAIIGFFYLFMAD